MDSNPRSPSTGSSVHSGACDATHAARCRREARNARSFASTSSASDLRLAWAPSHGQSELGVQRQQVTESFGRYISAIYADRFDSYDGQKLEVTGEQPASSGVVVRSQIIKANGESVKV